MLLRRFSFFFFFFSLPFRFAFFLNNIRFLRLVRLGLFLHAPPSTRMCRAASLSCPIAPFLPPASNCLSLHLSQHATIFYMSLLCMLFLLLKTYNFLKRFPFALMSLIKCEQQPAPLLSFLPRGWLHTHTHALTHKTLSARIWSLTNKNTTPACKLSFNWIAHRFFCYRIARFSAHWQIFTSLSQFCKY